MVLMTKKAADHKSNAVDQMAIVSPSKTVKTPRISGFRTYRYRPTTTSFFVGDHGASVPFPILIKELIVSIIITNPDIIRTRPRIKFQTNCIDQLLSILIGTM